jgi:hypothetical protein
VFDLLRKHGPAVIRDTQEVEISGTGAWKKLIVVNTTTGEQLVEKKFYKADFNDVWRDPEFKPYIDDLLEAAMIKKIESSDLDIDVESYEEVRAVAMEMELDTDLGE